jgi:hypothetical protein
MLSEKLGVPLNRSSSSPLMAEVTGTRRRRGMTCGVPGPVRQREKRRLA